MPSHHYVPQFLLRLFTDPSVPSGQTPYLWVYRPGVGWETQSPKNAAERTDYYALPAEVAGDGQALEQLLSKIENYAAPALRKALKGKLVGEDVKKTLALSR